MRPQHEAKANVMPRTRQLNKAKADAIPGTRPTTKGTNAKPRRWVFIPGRAPTTTTHAILCAILLR